MAEPLEGETFHLEGHDAVAIEAAHTETDRTTCLYLPVCSISRIDRPQ